MNRIERSADVWCGGIAAAEIGDAGEGDQERGDRTPQKWYNMQQIDMSAEHIEDFSPNLFWDADPADLDFSKHMKYVVQRVLERGTLDDMRHMFSMYGFDNVVATSKTLRSLDPVSFSFIVNLSGQPKESFRCYTQKQSSQAPWIY